jgi:hypothetical protein
MEKYYTPEIEEIHPGFICEVLESNSQKWEEFKISPHEILKIQKGGIENVRVKYLDREDIEGEGWEVVDKTTHKIKCDYKNLTLHRNDEDYLFVDSYGNNVFRIHNGGEYDTYDGLELKINNLSEFRRILKQIGV